MGVRFGILSAQNVLIVGGLRARRNMLVVLNVTQNLSDVDVVFCARIAYNINKTLLLCNRGEVNRDYLLRRWSFETFWSSDNGRVHRYF